MTDSTHIERKAILEALGLGDENPGTYSPCGGWSAYAETLAMPSFEPATGLPIAKVSAAGDTDHVALLEENCRIFEAWRRQPAAVRGELIECIAAALRDKRQALAALIALETGKVLSQAEREVQEAIAHAEFAADLARNLGILAQMPVSTDGTLTERWHPAGPVVVITDFDAPVATYAKSALVAAVCGNPVIWKPSPKASLTALAVQRLIDGVLRETSLPRVFSLLQMRNGVMPGRLVGAEAVAAVFYAGPSYIGRQVKIRAAERMVQAVLDLPGNNVLIVDESADLDAAVTAALAGALAAAGQHGTAIRRLLVQESVLEPVTQRLLAAYGALRIGNPLAPNTDVGPLIDAAAVELFRQTLERVQREGGDVLCGGGVPEGAGYFVEPAIVRAENHWDVVQQEIPLPILYLIPYRSFDEALAVQNAALHPSTSTLFTGDPMRAAVFLSGESNLSDIAAINAGFYDPGGGIDCGWGGYLAPDIWKYYMRRQFQTRRGGNP